ncbi:hypothetical protein JTE90_002160 [Oedothorax gibbosus]|uniref:Membrane-bound transcription factor site-2 protease n=1 Tax=Oedothorax gibbosus TaxID=931172 RepID=A0AAV6V6J1_9ARAC|nr:hypothetical protein JTE90_002160 [Oedothorax gibbosus]
MSDLTFIIVILITFSVINFFDFIFKTCMFFPYMKFLEDNGVSIKLFGIVWETKRFNRKFQQFTLRQQSFLRSWFQVGANISMVLIIPAFFLVSKAFWQSLPFELTKDGVEKVNKVTSTHNLSSTSNTPVLVPIIPGFTLPLSQIYYYAGTLFLCVVFHELGHAIAACREQISLDACGVAIYGIVPIAYVKLPTEQMKNLLPKQLLRIYSAGIWHNLVLAFFALLLMWISPIFLSSILQLKKGVTVVSIKKDSSIGQVGGLAVNDEIFNISGCEVKDTTSWEDCLKKLHTANNQGFCTSINFIKSKNIAIKNMTANACCPNLDENLCFQAINTEIKFCLPGRQVAEKANICHSKNDCGDDLCLVPVFPTLNTKLSRIQRTNKISVIYIGYIPELKYSVSVSNWTTKIKILPVRFVDMFETFLVYIVTFSTGLAIMNLIPCFGLDGAHLIDVIIHLYFSNIIPTYEHRKLVINILNFLGLFISLGAVIYGVMKYVY